MKKNRVGFTVMGLVLALAAAVTFAQVSTPPPGTIKATNFLAPTAGAQMAAVGGIVTNTSGLVTQVTPGTVYCTGGLGSFPLSRFTMQANQTYLIVYACRSNTVYAKTAVTGPGSSGTTTPGIPNTYLAPIPGVETAIAKVVCGATTCATITDARVPSQWSNGGSSGAHITTPLANGDVAGHVALSSGGKTITFAIPYQAAPVCIVEDFTTPANNTAITCTTTTTTAVIAGGTTTDVVNYIIVGNPN